ncbi:multicopper oxidase family protein (plasmid) [Marinovum sp. KMM 9989]
MSSALTRRDVLAGLAALCVPGAVAAARQSVVLRPSAIVARVAGFDLTLLGFNGQVPGPEIRTRQGDQIDIRLENGLDDGALVHWHGLRVPNQMDGVNVLTQDVVVPGQSHDYRFALPDAGTYWYHSHYLSYDQVSRGLFGAFVVEETTPPDVDHDITAQLFDMMIDGEGGFDDTFDPAQFATAGKIGNVATAILSRSTVRRGDRLRLRCINPSIDRIYDLSLSGLAGAIVAHDGMPLAKPRPLSVITLAPGQRCDVIADVTGPISLTDVYDGGDVLLGEIAAEGAREPSQSAIPTLPPNAMPVPDRDATPVELVMQGGAGGDAHGGFGTWALNDVSGLPGQPLVDVRRGATVRITLRNQTAFAHVMHLHGHHFYEVDASGTLGDYRDSTLVGAWGARDILCVLDNPGAWMLHCHMLSHQTDGMATWVRVS